MNNLVIGVIVVIAVAVLGYFVMQQAGTDRSADSGTDTHAVEEVLWAMMAGATTYDQSANSYKRGTSTVITPASGSSAINSGTLFITFSASSLLVVYNQQGELYPSSA